jgi:glycerol-3-phosphate dehydrogenase
MKVSTEILVIGGGATGLGVAWDAALRGFKTLLVEKGDLAHGTSGRYHGLLHSGARYVVRDPTSAADCYRENLILRRLLPSAIEDTGGVFVALPEDPADYVAPFVGGCRSAGIPVDEVSPAQILKEEPLLSPNIVRAFRVPDAACDSFDAAHLLLNGLRAAGGEAWTRHKVVGLLCDGTPIAERAARVIGADLANLVTGERVSVHADMVINCTGAWAGRMAALAGCDVQITPGKGTMVAMNYRLANTVINRLKPPSDGDILVPVGTVCVMGTTEVVVEDPDQYAIDDDEIDLLLTEGEKLIPRFRAFRALRAWAGCRPLFHEQAPPGGDSRLMTRAHAILDHAPRDGVEGFVSVVGGKFTTFRLMAEQAVDLACRKLGTERKAVTAHTPLDPPGTRFHTLGRRLGEIESGDRAEIICECELVTREQVETALRASGSLVLNDLRRDLRLGMGPCQAGFCAYRAAGLLYDLTPPPPPLSPRLSGDEAGAEPGSRTRSINSALVEFLQERWKGLRPVMWGANLRQMELDLNIYRNLFGVNRLPTARAPEAYPSEKTA